MLKRHEQTTRARFTEAELGIVQSNPCSKADSKREGGGDNPSFQGLTSGLDVSPPLLEM
jgi:hypothetical protein